MKGFLVPRTRLGISSGTRFSRLLAIRALAKPLIARDLLDRVELPVYE
jgi:hypothetical protein